jgi:hypothetical protein
VIKNTRANPVMMIQKPYLSLSRSTSSAEEVVDGGVEGEVGCVSPIGLIVWRPPLVD